ncbi:MAG: alpha/beta hydrolase, partial [Ferruginibacter sp.]
MNIQKRFTFLYIRGKLKFLCALNPNWAANETYRLICTPLLNGTIKKSEVFLKYNALTMNFRGKKINGYSCGSGNRTALILHGFSSSSHNFDSYVDNLISMGYKVLAFDAPAHGLSEGKTINAVEYSDFILDVMKIHGHIDSFISHSFGGIAVMLALENLKHDSNTKIVLIAPATETTT